MLPDFAFDQTQPSILYLELNPYNFRYGRDRQCGPGAYNDPNKMAGFEEKDGNIKSKNSTSVR